MSIQKKSEKVTDKPEGKKNIKKSGEEKKGKEITAKKNSEKKEMENGTAVTSKKGTVAKDSVKIKKEKKTTAEKITKNDTAENEIKDDEEFEPWILIRNAKLTLFRSLNCIKEMYIQMLPILKKEDEERLNKLQQLSKDKEPLSYEKLNELLTIMDRLSLGEEIYRQSIIISLITKFDEFYSTILYVCLKENPKWINTAQKTLTYNDVLNIKSIEDFKKQIIDEEVEALMRDSHWKQIKYLDEKLKLGIFDDYNDIDKFLELTERRNLYVHTSGIVSNIYLSNLKKWDIPIIKECKEGMLLSSNESYINESINCIFELSLRITQNIIRRCYLEQYKEIDSDLISDGVDFIIDGNNELGERIFDYALTIPTKFIQEDSKYFFIINKALAQKNQKKDFKETIKGISWTSLNPIFRFAIAVLQNKYDEAYKLMKQEIVYEEIGPVNFKEWPLLKEIRSTQKFKDIYKEIFKKDISEEIKISDNDLN